MERTTRTPVRDDGLRLPMTGRCARTATLIACVLAAALAAVPAPAEAADPGWSGSVSVTGSHDACGPTTDCAAGRLTAVYFLDGQADLAGPPNWSQPATWTAIIEGTQSGPCSNETLIPGTVTHVLTGQGTGAGGAQVSVGFGADAAEYEIFATTDDFFALPYTEVVTRDDCVRVGNHDVQVTNGTLALCAGRSSTSGHDRPDTTPDGVAATQLHGSRTQADGAACNTDSQTTVDIRWDLVLGATDDDRDGTADAFDTCPPSGAAAGATRPWGTPAVDVPATWNPDQNGPCEPLDRTPPETTIDSGPSGATSDDTPTFTFTSSEAGSTFECSLDQGTAAFSPCASGDAFGPLADGAYTFRVRATDAAANTDATPATRELTLVTAAPNGAPVATDRSVLVLKSATTALPLSATDPDGDPLTYTVVTQPARGTLAGSPPNLTYTPNKGYTGPDQFTFRASDGSLSDLGTVSIGVVVDTAPLVADDGTCNGTGTAFLPTLTRTFVWKDRDGPLTPPAFSVVTPPLHGTVAITGDSWTYMPTSDATTDAFTFRAFDGVLFSFTGTVTLTTDPQVCPKRRKFAGA